MLAEPTRGRVVVVGDVMTDVVAVLAQELRPDTDTPGRVRTEGGGSAANTAHWLAAAGTPVTLVARVGDDELGRAACALLDGAGVDLAVEVDTGLATGTCVVLVGPDGSRTMVPDPGANAALRTERLPDLLSPSAARPADHLHLSGYPLLRGPTREAARAALAAAHGAGLTTSIDAASAGPLLDVGPALVRSWCRGVDLLLANADEAAVLTSDLTTGARAGDVRGAAARLAGELAAVVVVKLGAAGAVAATPDGVTVARGAPAVSAVDTTGAGDAFAAGLLAAWRPGRGADAELPAALDTATRLAAYAVVQVGARPAAAPYRL